MTLATDEETRAYGPFLTSADIADLRGDVRNLAGSVRALNQTVSGLNELIRSLFNLEAVAEPLRSTMTGVLPFSPRR